MSLVLEIKAGETLFVNGSEIQISVRSKDKVKITFKNISSFVFGKQVMTKEAATTPLRKIYFALQHAYAGESHGDPMAVAAVLSQIKAMPDVDDVDLGLELRLAVRLVRMGEFHPALKVLRDMIAADEAEIATEKTEIAA